MDWIELGSNPKENNTQVKQYRRQFKATYDVISPDSGAYGFTSTTLPGGKPPFISAIIWLCHVAKSGNAIALKAIGSEKVWIGAIHNGSPFHGCDQIVQLSELQKNIERLLVQIENPELFGEGELMDKLAMLSNGIIPDDLDKLWSGFPPTKAHALNKTGMPKWAYLTIVSIFSSIGVISAVVYMHNKELEKERARLALEQAAAMEADRIANLPKSDEVKTNNFIDWFNGENRIITPIFIDHLQGMIKNLSVNNEGWKLLSIACAKSNGMCELQYKRDQFSAEKPEHQIPATKELYQINDYNMLFYTNIKGGQLSHMTPAELAMLWPLGEIKSKMIPFLQKLDDLNCQVDMSAPSAIPALIASDAMNASSGHAVSGVGAAPGAVPGAAGPNSGPTQKPLYDMEIKWVQVSTTCDAAYIDIFKEMPLGSYIDSLKIALSSPPQMTFISYWFEVSHQIKNGNETKTMANSAPGATK